MYDYMTLDYIRETINDLKDLANFHQMRRINMAVKMWNTYKNEKALNLLRKEVLKVLNEVVDKMEVLK